MSQQFIPQGDPERITLRAKLAVLVAALGYFVDVFDLWLFANFRIASLGELGLSGDALTTSGAFILNCQQAGLLLGGFLWGVLADRGGRSKVMFASILVYSAANIANSYVTSVEQYAFIRFIAGLGLAGEIGAGVTLVSELLPRSKRGLGVTIVATVGVAGSVAAAYVGTHLEWRNGFLLGGVMGLSLLLLRASVHESGMYTRLAQSSDADAKCGSLQLLFSSWERTLRFLRCIAIGIPVWVAFGLYATFAPELSKALGVTDSVRVPQALLYASVGITLGDLICGLLSQWLKSRRKPIGLFILCSALTIGALYSGLITSANQYCMTLGVLGFFVGYWICALASTAEQFGTNLRGTVTTSIPNLVRATAIPINIGFIALREPIGTASAALCIAFIGYALATWALAYTRETFDRDLEFNER